MAVYYLYDLIISTLLMHVITLYNRFCSFATSSLFTLFGCLRTRPRPLKLHIHLGIEIIEPTHFKDSSRVNLLLWYIFLLSLRLLHCLYYTKYINFILLYFTSCQCCENVKDSGSCLCTCAEMFTSHSSCIAIPK